MTHKLLQAFAASLLVLAASTPTALAHGYKIGLFGQVVDGVAGTYYGSAEYFVSIQGELDAPPTNIDFVMARPMMLCDLEVGGDGTSEQEPDETVVDSEPVEIGLVPDGTFNDGGNGGACHTNHYEYRNDYWLPTTDFKYNTPGCLDDGARANNINPFNAPWVGASCDWKTVWGGTPRAEVLIACLPPIRASSIDSVVPKTLDCGFSELDCTANPLTCTQEGVEHCGSDFYPDGINFGKGNSRTPYPHTTPTGQSFSNDGLGCHWTDATMAAFVFTGVIVVQEGIDIGVTIQPALQGDIWQIS
ncbi:MAG: hypothetical protein ACYC2H_11940 [Thermoplasmatota archaeon]